MKYAELTICLTGIALLAYWLLKTSLGRRALADSMPRRNNMPLYLPAILFILWLGTSLAAIVVEELYPDLPNWQRAIVDNIVSCVGAILMVAVITILAWAHFARRLKGFGLNFRALPRDLLTAPLYLLAAWPLIMVTIWLTINIAQLVSGHDYQMQPHQQLKLAAQHPQLALHVLIFVGAVVIGPVFEELFFRGIIQTMLLSYVPIKSKAWIAIAITSVLFALMHEELSHRPALFVLGACMGYAYEKSGSLWRPIFIHAIFNATNVIATMSK
ncbi:MAG: CPBP family intramembrane metalloprotease [Phycisphaerae bacterium]|nr:CPBP family intramembrane metalloprotease [Phycisphaerae bacterium]